METLKELALILTRNKAKAIDLLDASKHKTSKINTFYSALVDGKCQTEEDALQLLYPDQDNKSSYRKLKSSLKSRMINSLFFIDVKNSSYTARQSAYYACQKDWAAVSILMGKNAFQSSVELCQKILRYAKKFEFTDLVRDVANLMCLYYSTHTGDVNQYRFYRDMYDEYDDLCRNEDKACRYYSDLMIEYVNTKARKKHLFQQATANLQKLAPLMHIQSYRMQLYSYLLELIKYSANHDYEKVLERAKAMETFFAAKKYIAATPLQIAAYYQLVACTQLQRYEAGSKVAEKCIDLLEDGSFNWFKYNELYFSLAMHSGQYREAYHIYEKIRVHPRFKYLPDHIKETWTIFDAYLHYLAQAGLLPEAKHNQHYNKFRLGRFLNDTPVFAKDKRGMNIAILVIQILFLIAQKRYGVAIDKFEAIEKYCSRYLQESETIRSFYLVKMLLTIPEASFHRVAVERKAEKYVKKLQQLPLQKVAQTFKIEVLPYEKIWDLALKSLDNKIYSFRKNSA